MGLQCPCKDVCTLNTRLFHGANDIALFSMPISYRVMISVAQGFHKPRTQSLKPKPNTPSSFEARQEALESADEIQATAAPSPPSALPWLQRSCAVVVFVVVEVVVYSSSTIFHYCGYCPCSRYCTPNNPKLQTLNPKPQTPNPQPQTPNLKPYANETWQAYEALSILGGQEAEGGWLSPAEAGHHVVPAWNT